MIPADRSAREYWDDTEIRSLGPFLVSGVACLCGAAALPEHSLARDLVRDVGVAFLISVLVGGFIEFRRHERSRRAAELGMLELLGELLVPKELLAQFTQNILSSGIICEPWHLVMRLEPFVAERATAVASGGRYLRSRSTLSYQLKNCLLHEQTIKLNHELGNPNRDLGDETLQARFERITWCVSTAEGEVLKRELRDSQIDEILLPGDQGELAIPCTLPANGVVSVELVRTELIPCPGQFPWYMFWSTLNPTVRIETSGLEDVTFDLLLRHPNGRHLKPERRDEWTIKAALVHGQGFAITATVKDLA